MHKRILVALALAVLFSGVGMTAAQTSTWTPTPDGQWCYRFDFASGDHGFTAPANAGVHEPGINGGWRQSVPEAGWWGYLTLNYTHTVTVFPSEVEIKLRRGGLTMGPIDAQIAGNLFGLEIQPEPTLFTVDVETDVMSIVVSPLNADDFSNQLNLYVDARQFLYVTDIYVRGFGVNPFERSNCIEEEPGPVATGTPTVTATAMTPSACLLPGQATPTPTSSPGPSPTPDCGSSTWYKNFDFTQGTLGWSAAQHTSALARYTTNSHWYFGTNTQNTYIQRGFSGTVTQVKVYWRLFGVYSPRKFWALGASEQFGTSYALNYTTLTTDTVDVVVFPGGQYFQYGVILGSQSTSGTNWGEIYRIEMWGTGPDPFNGGQCYIPTETPLPACTLTPTVTPSVSPTPSNTPTPFTLTPTFTRTPTRTPFPIVIPTLAPTRTPAPTNTAGPPTATLNPSITPTGTIGPIQVPGGISGDGGNGGLRGLGNAITGLATNLWGRASGWASDVGSRVTGIGQAWNSAVPTAPPMLPRCQSDPFANELCAIWYILRFTVLAGAIGALIIPAALVLTDLIIFFFFLKLARALVSQAKELRR